MPEKQGRQASREWKQARRAALLQDTLGAIGQRRTGLLSFEEARERLRLDDVHYLGLQQVALDQIVGSVERYHDFNRAFLPRQEHLQERWQQIESLVARGYDLPPIELYKVGPAYFVRDGNHRVSVARRHGRTSLPALVWEYNSSLPLDPDAEIDHLLGQAAHNAFMQATQIERICPGVEIRLGQADGYQELLNEIQEFRQIISQIDEGPVTGDEALALWCALCYAPVVEIVRQQHILADFPGRTEADLYLWLRRNLTALDLQYGRSLSLEEAARVLAHRSGETPFSARPLLQGLEATIGGIRTRAAEAWDGLKRTLRRMHSR